MSFFKSIFGGHRTQEESSPRSLDHPRDLQIGDIIKFGFAPQTGISNQAFTVEGINTCDLGGEDKKKIVFTIEGGGQRFRLAVVEERTGARLEIARAVLPDDVRQVFDIDAFVDLLDPDTGVNHVLERMGEPDYLVGWTAPVYRQEAGHNAYYYTGDYRHRLLPQDAEEGEAFSYYLLVSDDRRFALEAQVYEGGRTKVYLLANLAPSKAEELWPLSR